MTLPSRNVLVGIALLVLLVIVTAFPSFPGLTRLRFAWMDVCQQLAPRIHRSDHVMIVAVDDRSLEQHGQWPWPRTLLARLVGSILDARPAAVGMDLLMSEPDRLSPPGLPALVPTIGPELASRLAQIPSNDSVLAATMRGRPVVVGAAALKGVPLKGVFAAPRRPSARVVAVRISGGAPTELRRVDAVLQSVDEISAAARGHGLLNADVDGGAVRRLSLVADVNGVIMPSLALEMLRVAQGRPEIALRVKNGRVQAIGTGTFMVPTQADGSVWLRYGRHAPARFISAADVLSGSATPDFFRDRLVLIGTTALGLAERQRITGTGDRDGVEIHAEIIESLLERTLLARPSWARWVECAFVLLGGVLVIVTVPLQGERAVVLVLTPLMLVAFVGSFALYRWALYLMDASTPSLALMVLFVTMLSLTLAELERRRKHIRRAFQQYVSSELVARIAEDPDALKFGGDFREVTVMFSDIREFTTFTEEQDPQVVVEMLREYLTAMTALIFREGGTLDKYIGDAVMAEFGTPVTYPDHALRCCRVALRMIAEVDSLRTKWLAEGRQPFRIGIGINTGRMIAGNLGSEQRFDYTVIGDDVNVAARLESLNKEYATTVPIIISDSTYRAAGPTIQVRPLGEVKVKGKTRPVQIYELLGLREG
jgi:adenylate cyclase